MTDNYSSYNHLQLLTNIRMVMIGTTLPANIGSAARAMHTMGLEDLAVVNPRLPIDDSSFANAAGACSVLENTKIVTNTNDALADCSLVFAASARSRQMPRPVVTPDLAAKIMQDHLDKITKTGQTPKVAILFGREDRGLTNEELALAHYHIQIPANPTYPVLNVASAMQVIAANIYAVFSGAYWQTDQLEHILNTKQTQGVKQTWHQLPIYIRSQWDEPAITQEQAQSLDACVIKLLKKLQLAKDDQLKHLPSRLSRLSGRLQLDQKEYALIRALLAKLDHLASHQHTTT